MNNIHATLINYQGKGILLRGKSGNGKSDLALRLIVEHNAILIADDRVNLFVKDNILYGSVPDEIKGKIEIRGLGIAEFPFEKECPISLIADLVETNDIERMPLPLFENLCGFNIEKINLFPFECSAPCKIITKICGFIR